MPLLLDANGNITANDTATYTWANVVALNSSKLDIYGDVSKPFYRWRGTLDIVNATLKVENTDIELYGTSITEPGIFRVTGTGSIIFGDNTGSKAKNGCNIKITRKFSNNLNNFSFYSPLSYCTTDNDKFRTAPKIRIFNSRIFISSLTLIPTFGGRIYLFISELRDVFISLEATDTANDKRCTLYMQPNGIVSNVNSKAVPIDLLDITTIEKYVSVDTNTPLTTYAGAYFFTTLYLEITDSQFFDNIYSYSRDQCTGFVFLNSASIDIADGIVTAVEDNYPYAECIKTFSHDIKLVDINGNVDNAIVTYEGRSNLSFTSNSLGTVNTFKLICQETNIQSLPFPGNYTDYITPVPVNDYFSYNRSIKSYLHEAINETIIVNSQIGTSTNPFLYSLTIDTGVTETNTTVVNNYTGIVHTANTITVTEARTLNEIYDSRKLYWRNNVGITAISKEADIFNLNDTNLIIDGISLTTTDKFKSITTTGTINYLNNGNTAFSTTDSNGIRFRVYGLPTTHNPIIRIKNLTNSELLYPTITNGEVYITLDEDTSYEFRADARGYLASNFITVNTSTSTELKINLLEFKDNNNNNIYGQGILAEKNLINYDITTSTIIVTYSISNPTISLFSIFDKIEETLATTVGLEVTAYPIYQNNKLVFSRDILTSNQNNIKIKPAIGNTGDPEFLFELVREGDEKPYNLFDFSTSNGRTIKYPTTVNIATFSGQVTVNNQDVATAVWSNTTRTLTSSSTLTPEQETKLNNLDVAVSTRLAATSYLQAPTTTQIKTEIESSTVLAKEATTASRASQTSVDLIPTNTVLTTDIRLNNLDTAVSSRLATNAYNAAPSVTDIRTGLSTELSRIDATVSSRATPANVWSNSNRSLTEGVTVNTNNDKTDYSLSAISINNIWNTLITSLNTAGSIGKRIVDFLDITISSRSSESTVNTINTKVNSIPSNPLLTTDVRLNTLDANISTRLASSNYLAPLTSAQTNTLITNALNTITLSGLTTEQNNKLNEINANVLKLKKLRGLVSGVNVIAKAPSEIPGYLKTSDNDINLVITKVGDEEILSG